MRLLSVSGCRISTARSLTGEHDETSLEHVALAMPRAPRRSGAGQRLGRRPGAQARRHPQRDAAEDPPGFSIHESSTISGVWPLSPCYSNLVLFDPLKPHESVETVIPELAERWSWQDTYRNLVFFLRKNVRWHDGQPFSAKDVKYTQWPYVKNLVPHNALYNYGRMQDVWLDK